MIKILIGMVIGAFLVIIIGFICMIRWLKDWRW